MEFLQISSRSTTAPFDLSAIPVERRLVREPLRDQFPLASILTSPPLQIGLEAPEFAAPALYSSISSGHHSGSMTLGSP